VREVVLLLKGVAFELEQSSEALALSGGSVSATSGRSSGLEVPQRVMASVYQATAASRDGTARTHSTTTTTTSTTPAATTNMGYRAHRDHAPPADDDLYWCWKSDREQSERYVTAILYVNPPRWRDGIEETVDEEENETDIGGGEYTKEALIRSKARSTADGASGSGGGGGQLRLFPGADLSDSEGSSFLPSQSTYDDDDSEAETTPASIMERTPNLPHLPPPLLPAEATPASSVAVTPQPRRAVDIAPIGGRLVLFQSRDMLHAVLPMRPLSIETTPALKVCEDEGRARTATRLAFSCWVLRSDKKGF